MTNAPPRRLTRSRDHKLGGVAAGIAEYFDLDPTLVRLAWVVLAVLGLGGAVLAYLVMWVVVPGPRGDAPSTATASSPGARSGQAVLVLLAVLLVVLLSGWFTWFGFLGLHLLRLSLPAWIVLIVVVWLVLRSRHEQAS